MITIYTDGSAKKYNKGGFAAIAIKDGSIDNVYHEEVLNTTNNRMELMGIIKGLEWAETLYSEELCVIYTDSMYCVNICNRWLHTWARNNWKNSSQKKVENLDLVSLIYHYLNKDFFNAEIRYCQGHCGIVGNELVDALATNNIKKYKKILKENNVEKKDL